MLYLDTPLSVKTALFSQAAALGASDIRLDIELSGVFPGHLQGQLGRLSGSGLPPADWSGVNQYMNLARRYHLRVLADLTSTPNYMAQCPRPMPPTQWYRCPPRDPAAWAREAGAIAAHARGLIDNFEIINEPDARWSFLGTAQQYAAVLSSAYRAIHAADPAARVALGGLGHVGAWGRRWMDAVLATPGADAIHRFDMANIHVRVPPSQAGGVVCSWRTYFAKKGFRGPLWVTETGYPADPAQQNDSGYQSGVPAQARWLASVIPTLLRAGAARVFVTLRDSGVGPYASEGVLASARALTPGFWFRRRPSFYTIQRRVDERAGTAGGSGC